MATTFTNLQETLTFSGTGSWTGAAGIGQGGGSLPVGNGGGWSSMGLTFTFGTGNNQINMVYIAQRTVTGSGTDNLDFGAGSLKAPNGDTATFSKIKAIIVNIESPDGTKYLQVGPQSVTHAFQGPFDATTDYKKVFNSEIVCLEPITGFTVTSTTGVLGITNGSASSLTYDIIVLGLN